VQLVVKSQVLAGGRGLGKFKNGFQGGVHIVKTDKVEETAGNEDWVLSFLDNLIEGFSFCNICSFSLSLVVSLFVEWKG